MRVAVAAWTLVLGISIAGCGGTVIEIDSQDGGGDASFDTRHDVYSVEDTGLRDGVVIIDTGGHDTAVTDAFVDPGCPDSPAPPKDYKCDPLAPPPGGCKAGEACYPYVEYPTDPCEHEVYHTVCMKAGTGTSGDPCSTAMCAAGFACVVSGAGNVCVKMCVPGKTGACPDGQICEPTDVPGVGGCL